MKKIAGWMAAICGAMIMLSLLAFVDFFAVKSGLWVVQAAIALVNLAAGSLVVYGLCEMRDERKKR